MCWGQKGCWCKMKKAFIWDLDGTLFDSYPMIIASLQQTLEEAGLALSPEEIREIILRDSVTALLEMGSEKTGRPFDALMQRHKQISEERLDRIVLLPGARELLTYLRDNGIENHVYTHRGATSEPVLKMLGIRDFFGEIITSVNGFARKPAPDGLLYLEEKLGYPMEALCYVGDRRLDMDCALNAGMPCVLLLTPNGPTAPTGRETATIHSLLEIQTLLETGVL